MNNEKHPPLSVLMPVYNTEKYVAEAVESILNQTFADFEFIIINDGSTDRSLEILWRYEKQDPRIRLISRENRGLVETRNELLCEAKGELVAWADSDDMSYPNRLEKQVACFQQNPTAVWCYVSVRFVDPVGMPLYNEEVLADGWTGVVMMRRKTAVKLGGFRKELRMCEDYDLALRMEEVGSIVSLREVLIDYRQHPESVCNSERMAQSHYRNLVKKLAEDRRTKGKDALQRGESWGIAIPTELHKPITTWKLYTNWGWRALKAGNVVTSRKYAVMVLTRRPWSIDSWRLMACAIRGH